MTTSVNMKSLLEAGVHFGHQTRRWNPKMKKYIFGDRNGIHIIDLQKTVKLFQQARDVVEETASHGGHVLFVGTKKQAREIVATEARRAGMYFVNHRWLGGMLTNFPTIRKSIHRLKRIENMGKDGTFDKLTKKEVLYWKRELEKLERNLGGIKDMPGLPDLLFIVDSHAETVAVSEAKRLGIPVVAVADTNANPDDLDYVIPGNDDSVKSINLFVASIADACISGKGSAKYSGKAGKQKAHVREGSFYDEAGNVVAVEEKKVLVAEKPEA